MPPACHFLSSSPSSRIPLNANHVFTRHYDMPDLGLIFFLPLAFLLMWRILVHITKGIRLVPQWGAMLCIVALPAMWIDSGYPGDQAPAEVRDAWGERSFGACYGALKRAIVADETVRRRLGTPLRIAPISDTN